MPAPSLGWMRGCLCFVYTMRKNLFPISFLVFCLLTYLCCFFVVHDTNQGLLALNSLKPLVDLAYQPADVFYRPGHHWHEYSLAAAVLALSVFAVFGVSSRQRYFVLSVALAIGAQFLLTNFNTWRFVGGLFGLPVPVSVENVPSGGQHIAVGAGVFLYLLAFIFVLRAFKGEKSFIAFDTGREERGLFGTREFAILGLVFLVALLVRMYALNVVADVFEGEIAAFSAGGTSIPGMFVANEGKGGPWSPLGILYYIPIYITTKLFGTTLIALRLSSAFVGILTVPLVYLLAARLGGRLAGLLAAALFSLNCLHVGWARTDVFPHGGTTWLTLLLCLALLKAYDTRKFSWACVVALLMGVSWHQYPSGQSASLIPVLAIGFFWLTNRLSLPLSKLSCVVVSLGVVLWFLGYPLSNYLADGNFRFLNPFTLTGPRATWSAGDAPQGKLELFWLVASSSLAHFGDVLQGLFFRQNVMCHQEWLRPTQGTYTRAVPWMEMPFIFIGMALLWRYRGRFETAVLVGWMVAALLPGVLSEAAYPKRLSTFYPALDIIAALALATLVYYRQATGRLSRRFIVVGISVGLLAYTSLAAHFWFSGKVWKYKEPTDVAAAARIAEAIRPDTIILEFMYEGYDRAKYLYLLLDALSDPARRPNRWVLARGEEPAKLVADPLASRAIIQGSWVYTWTKLRDQFDESLNYDGWKRVVFLVQTPSPYYRVDEGLLEAAKKRCPNPKIEQVEGPKTFVIIECDLKDLR
jgi:hypothetical protein